MKKLIFCIRLSFLLFLMLSAIDAKAEAQPLNGIYYIGGTSYDFANVQNAVIAVSNGGVTGPVTFIIRQGTYPQQFNIPSIAGASATNPIKFISEFSDPSDVILTFSATTYGSHHTVRLTGAKYITFKRITIEATGVNYAVAVMLMDDADYNTFDSCHLIAPVSTNSGNSFQAPLYCDQWSGTAVNADYLTIKNCEITGGVNGIFWRAYITGNARAIGTEITNNKFLDQSTNGLNLSGISGILFSNNTIVPNPNTLVNYSAMQINYAEGNSQIIKNNINGYITSGNLSGIKFGNSKNATGDIPLIANNIISLADMAGHISGLYFWNITNTDVVNNTVVSYTGNSFTNKVCNLVSGIDGIKIFNNIFKNKTANDTSYAIYKTYNTGYPVTNVVSNNNDFISKGKNLCRWELTDCADLGSWRDSSGNDSSSMSVDIAFIDEFSKPVLPVASELNDSLRVSLNVRVTDDYFGQARLTPTCVGADERHAPICGVKTIGQTGCDYTNFTDAIADWNYGICGPIHYIVNIGTYNEAFTIAGLKTMNYPITFSSVTDNPNDVLISSNASAVVTLDSVNNISFYHIGIRNYSITNGIAIEMIKGCDSISFHRCYFEGVNPSATVLNGYQIVRVYDASYPYCKNTDYLTFDSCSFNRGNCGIEYVANPNATPVFGESIHITNCHFYNQYIMAMRLCGINNANITSNSFSFSALKYSLGSVGLEQLYGTTEFSNNIFNYSAFAQANLVDIGPGNKSTTDSLFFTNNMLRFDLYTTKSTGPPDTLSNITGLNVHTMYYNNFIYNNTLTTASEKNGKTVSLSGMNNAELKNNIIINRTSSNAVALITQKVDSLASRNNDFFSTGPNLIISDEDTLHDLDSWRVVSPGYDSGSISKNVVLDIAHLTPESEQDQDLWKPQVKGVTTDYYGDERSIYLSCIGADERTLTSDKAFFTFALGTDTDQFEGIIDEGVKTISIILPANVAMTGKAIFENSTGSVVLFNGIVELSNSVSHDFSSELVFTVVASDNTTTSYTVTTAYPDIISPTAPTLLTANDITATSVRLTWNASTDNVGVTGYVVYSGTDSLTTVTGLEYVVNGLTPLSNYTYTIKAKDAAGNKSSPSNAVNIKTLTNLGNWEMASDVNIFPNPCFNKLTIKYAGLSQAIAVSLIDISGRTILITSLNSKDGTYDLTIPPVRQGIYFVKIQNQDNLIMRKIEIRK